MKVTIGASIATVYNDGAGNSCTYTYQLATKAFTFLATKLWKMRVYRLKLPTTATTIVASARGSVVGAPPAAAARSMTVSTLGVWAFGANETMTMTGIVLTASDTEEHPYEYMSMMVLDPGTLVSTITSATAGGVNCKDTWTVQTFIADTNTISASITPSATGLASLKFPANIDLVVAETDLVTREYDGKYAELGSKLLVSGLQIMSKQYAGVASQAYQYAAGNGSPIAIELYPVMHTTPIGAV